MNLAADFSKPSIEYGLLSPMLIVFGVAVVVLEGDHDLSTAAALRSRLEGLIAEGVPVRQGQVVGYVGDSGNAGAGNTHLHFAISWMRAGDGWWQGEPVDPYPLLAGKTASS